MKKEKNIFLNINKTTITLFNSKNGEFINLSQMIKAQKNDIRVRSWLRSLKTVEFLEAWELLYNSKFNEHESVLIKNQIKTNKYQLSPLSWVKRTNAIGIFSKSGKYGGVYAHFDIAIEFATWISPIFKLHLIKDYQRLKKLENTNFNYKWEVYRAISKKNYTIQTDAIKKNLVNNNVNKNIYCSEADLLNKIIWGITAKQWREKNPILASQNKNIREYSTENELIVLSNLQSINAWLIEQNISKMNGLKN